MRGFSGRGFHGVQLKKERNKKSLEIKHVIPAVYAIIYMINVFGFYPAFSSGIITTLFFYLIFFACLYYLEIRYKKARPEKEARLFYLFFLIVISIINMSGGIKSDIRWAVYAMVFLLINRKKYVHAAATTALSFVAFIKGIKDFSAYDFTVFASLVGISAVFYLSAMEKVPDEKLQGGFLDEYDIETGKDIKDFGDITSSLLSNLLDIYFLLFKPFSILLFLKSIKGEKLYKLLLFSSKQNDAVKRDCVINMKEGALGMAAQKNDFFVFSIKDINMPYYKKDTEIKTVVTMPVILDKVLGLIVMDFQEEAGAIHEGMKVEMQKLISEIAFVISLYGINRKAIFNQERVSFLYKTDEKLNLMEGPHKLAETFFTELKKLDICSGYIAKYIPQDKTFEVIETFNYPVSVKNEKISAKDDETLRTIYYSEKSSLFTDVQNKNFRINFGKKNVSKFLLTHVGKGEQMFGFVKLDKEEEYDFPEFEIKTLEMIIYRITIILENAGLYEKIKRQATEDGLTGLLNHLTFQERLTGGIEMQKKGDLHNISLLLIDIDFFKKFNDDFGHQEGDRVLIKVGGMLKDFGKRYPGIYPARYGGEEFVMVMENKDIYEATRIAEEIRKYSEENLSGGNPKETRRIKLSCGVASYPDYARDARELIKNADEALYAAKEQGRNKVKNILEVIKEINERIQKK